MKSLADIKGKMVGFGDFASTSSHLIPRALLARNGLFGDTDYKYVLLGAHDAVARAVQSGQVQAGGLSQEIFKSLVAKGSIDGSKIDSACGKRPNSELSRSPCRDILRPN